MPLLLIPLAHGCGSEDRDTDASAVQRYHLEEWYPADFPADGQVLPRELIARGDSLYHRARGRANCILCHGPFLRGGSEGTNLRDDVWHNGDGSYGFIISTILTGVSKPDHLPMPPMGGIALTEEEVRAIAAYVYWVANRGHPAARGGADAESTEPGPGL